MSHRRVCRSALLLLLAAVLLVSAPARAQTTEPVPGPCIADMLPSGALSLVCIPTSGWNGDLVVYAHGYVAPDEPLGFYNLTLPDGTYLPDLTQSLGYAFATTSYRQNGLAVLEGVQDIRELVAAFAATAEQPVEHTYMLGVSEGGLVSTLLIERYPELFSGGLAACGPIGDFQLQVNYIGDARVLFDYFFPGIIPGSPVSIPPEVIAQWNDVYAPAVQRAVATSPANTTQLITTGNIAVGVAEVPTAALSVQGVLWFNVFATNDAQTRLGGNPYDNVNRTYSGSNDDATLNAAVPRFPADAAARVALAQYQTSGQLRRPLIVMHTTGDQIVPFQHATLYAQKVSVSEQGSFMLMTIDRYSHCSFTANEIVGAFKQLVLQVVGGQRLFLPLTLQS